MRSKAIAVGYSSVLALGLLSAATPAMAGGEYKFNDDFSAKWNLKASVGAISRMESASKENLFAGDTPGGTSGSAVSDDGNLNYDGGEVVSSVVKAIGDFNLQYKNYGLFVQAKTWYDYTQKEGYVPHGNDPNEFQGGKLSDDGFHRNSQFQGATFQQVFAHGTFQVNEQPLKVAAGRKLLLWGRSLYSRGSFSSLNAVDLAALHRPGSEYTEFLTPSGMVTVDYNFTDRLSMKSFYQYEWRAANLDGCGTFFSTLDNTALGCDATFSSSVIMPNQDAYNAGVYIPRRDENEPKDGGQYGLKFDYAFPESKAKIGTYFFNYHSRLPYYSVTKEDNSLPQGLPGTNNEVADFYEYPEDIQVFGLTADKTFEGVGNLALNLSYLPDMPIQINTPDLTTSRVLEANGVPAAAVQGAGFSIPQGTIDYVYNSGSEVHGFEEFDIQRAELAFTTIIPKLMGAQKTVVSMQVGSEFIPDLPKQDQMRFRRHTNFGVGELGEDGYVTDFSWGYQLSLTSTYANAIGAVSLTPGLTFNHGVEGYSSDDAMQEDARTVGVSLGMAYKQLSANLSYTTYNDEEYSVVEDRDYLSLSTTYNF